MKMNKLTAALVAATAFAAGNASALVVGVDTPDIVINMSGATASDVGFSGVFEGLCVAGTLTSYTDRCNGTETAANLATCAATGGKVPGAGYSGYFCEIPAANIGLAGANRKVLVRKRSEGGSGWGVQPVADAAQIDFMKLDNTNCLPTAADPNVYKCNRANVEQLRTDAGISDEEPALFVAPNVPSGFTPVTGTQIGRLDFAPVAVLTFGIPVTNPLYAALQQAQGLNPDLDGDLSFEGQHEWTDAAEIGTRPADWQDQIRNNMPNLTKDQVANLMKGGTARWNNVRVGDDPTTAADESVSLVDLATNNGIPVAYTEATTARVTVCRRVNGSGTQAQMNALFLNVPCSKEAEFPAADNTACHNDKGAQNTADTTCTSGAAWAGYADMRGVQSTRAIVFENSGSGDVEKCLNELSTANRWALGIQSMEKISPLYSYVKLDGVAPTLDQVAKATYFDWAASTMQWRRSTAPFPPSADQVAVLNKLRAEFGKPSILDDLNDGFVSNFGPVGWLSAAGTPVRPFNADLPVMEYTRGTSTCNMPKSRGFLNQIDL